MNIVVGSCSGSHGRSDAGRRAGTSPTNPLRFPRAYLDGTGPGWRAARGRRLHAGQLRPRHLDVEGWSGPLHGASGGRDPDEETRHELRAGSPVAASEVGGNSGIFVWASEKALTGLKPNSLPPGGIEVQILDHGYAEQYEKNTGKKPDWFTTHGDVFPVGSSRMKPFPPVSPDGSRSFPTKHLSKGVGEWNHYYVRCINGEVRLWVNGEEVSGGNHCEPATGFLCLESEGSPVEFKNLRIRELP